MKFSLNWLKEFVPLNQTVDELAESLTMAGVEVEDIEAQGAGFHKVVVARILKSDPHPNADRLSVCEVEDGSGRKQIVCGAKNYKIGDKVPLALPGAKLPNGMEIKRSKLRGVESDGMMCSPKELGLTDDAEGLLILAPDLNVGTPLTEALGLNDTIFDLEITPNRPDLLSHWGLAREIAALASLPAPDPHKLLVESDESQLDAIPSSQPPFPVRVEDPALCPRYTARIIRGVKVGPSPAWLRRRLEALGQRSISNVVDITNFILLEIGQPLHAFDLKLLEGPEIIVRCARAGEKLLRLDDETSELKDSMLVIADARRAVALAGVIGGRETAVSGSTTDLLLESATFQPSSIRKTSKTLSVSTDSSYRFERGVDVELAAWASKRATALILQICGGTVEGTLVDARAQPRKPSRISCRYTRANSILGVTLAPGETQSILQRLGCRVTTSADSCDVETPSWRPDLEREIDLIEELARVHGIAHIPGAVQPFKLSTTRDSASFLFARKLRTLAAAQGLDEAQDNTITSSVHPTPAGPLILANPLNSEMDTLRPHLLTGLLEAAARNLTRGNESVALFEIGTIFNADEGRVGESTSLGIILAGARRGGASWEQGMKPKPYDFHDLVGIVDGLASNLGLSKITRRDFTPQDPDGFERGIGFALADVKNRTVGRAGKISRALARRVKLSADAYYAELDAGWLLASQNTESRYKPWTVYPPIRRDIALTVDRSLFRVTNHQHISETLQAIAKKIAGPKGILLQELQLFDIFESEKIGADKKSLAYALIYQSPQKTLTDAEVNEVHEAIKKNLKDEIACELRG